MVRILAVLLFGRLAETKSNFIFFLFSCFLDHSQAKREVLERDETGMDSSRSGRSIVIISFDMS